MSDIPFGGNGGDSEYPHGRGDENRLVDPQEIPNFIYHSDKFGESSQFYTRPTPRARSTYDLFPGIPHNTSQYERKNLHQTTIDILCTDHVGYINEIKARQILEARKEHLGFCFPNDPGFSDETAGYREITYAQAKEILTKARVVHISKIRTSAGIGRFQDNPR